MRYYKKIIESKGLFTIIALYFLSQFALAQTPPEVGGCDYTVGDIVLTANNVNATTGFETIFAYSDSSGNFLGFSNVNTGESNPTESIAVLTQGTYVFYAINYLVADYSSTPINGFSSISALTATTSCININQFTASVCEAIPTCFPSCSSQAWLSLAIPGTYNTSAGYSQMYAVVDASGVILQITSDGIYSVGTGTNDLQAGTTYNVYAVNFESSGSSYVDIGDNINVIFPTAPAGVCINVSGPATVTICSAPVADILANVNACGSYTLQTLSAGNNYYTGTGGTGTMMNAGDVISSTTTLYIYAESGTVPNCTDETDLVITINPNPSVTSLTHNSPICSGSAATFTITGTANSTVSYTLNGGAVQTVVLDASGSATVSVSGATVNQTIVLTDVALSGCNTSLTNTSIVVVNPNPSVTSLTSNSPICSGSVATFTITGTANSTVSYTLNGGAVQTVVLDASGSATVSVSGATVNQTISLANISIGSCNAVVSQTSTIVVNSATADAPTNVIACDNYTLPALSIGNNYYTGSGGTGTMLNAGNVISLTTILYVYAQSGTCTDENSFVITINRSPVAGIISGANVICADGSDVLFTSTVTGGEWSSSDSNILAIDINTGEAIGVSSGTATIYYTVTGNSPCSNAVASFNVVVNEIADFSIIAGCVGDNFTLASSITNSGLTYEWFNSSGVSIGAGSSHIIKEPGNYELQISTGGCVASAFISVENAYCEIPKGISPNGDGLNDYFDLSNFDVQKLEIFNRYGMKVYEKANYVKEWEGFTDKGQILPDATYYYVIYFNNSAARTGWVYINRQH